MRFACVLALLLSGASAEISGCVVDPDGSHTCDGALPLGDVTSLLQVHKRQQDASATVTRRCSGQNGSAPPNPACVMEAWSDWGSCTKTCESGTRTRSRKVTSAPDGAECGCLEETETCNSNECDEPIDPQGETTPAPVGPNSLEFKVCGRVKSAEDDSDIAGATVTILDKETQSDATGGFCVEKVPEGTATLSSKKDGWVDVTDMELAIKEDTQGIRVYMSKELDSPKDWRIVLTWGMTPLDLDARTQFANEAAGCEVSYDKRSATCAQNGIDGKLDLDHCFYAEDGKHSCDKHASLPGGPSAEPKPETTTLLNVDAATCGDNCKIHFHVSNYMSCLAWNTCPAGAPTQDTGTLKDSQAEVRVIHGDKQVAFFKLAAEDGKMKYGPDAPWASWNMEYKQGYEEWWVFYIDVTTEKVLNCKTEECFQY